MLGVFDAARHARHARHIAFSISLHRSGDGFGYALWIDTSAGRKTEALEVIWEHERVGCMWAMIRGSLCDACISFLLARESAKGKRYMRGSVWICVGSMEGWEDDFVALIYAPVSAVSWLVGWS